MSRMSSIAPSGAPHKLPGQSGAPLRHWLKIDGQEWRTAVTLGWPIALTAWANMGMSITDTWMLTALGPTAVAAAAVGSDYQSIVFYPLAGIIAGLMPMLAAAAAAGDRCRVHQLWRTGWLLMLGCLAVGVPAIWYAPQVLERIGVPRTLIDPGILYTRFLAANLVPLLALALIRSVLVAHYQPRVLLQATLLALPLNALLNAALIHGFGPLPAYGIAGAGAATLASSCCMVLLTGYRLYRSVLKPEPVCAPLRMRADDIRRGLRIGMPIGITTLAEIGVYLGATLYVATLSVESAAAHTLTVRMAGLAYALPMALMQVVIVRVAATQAHGYTHPVLRTGFQFATVNALLLAASLALTAVPLSTLLDDGSAAGASAAAMAVRLLLLLALIEAIEPYSAVITGILRARNDTFVPMLLVTGSYWLLAAPAAWWLVQQVAATAESIWLALLVGMLSGTFLLALRYCQQRVSTGGA